MQNKNQNRQNEHQLQKIRHYDGYEPGFHQPVLLESVLELLEPKKGESYLDLTAGYGGHASAVVKLIGKRARATLVDRDSDAIGVLQEKFGDEADVVHTDFVSFLSKSDNKYDLVLADLGVSSPQLDNSNRGFSFRFSAPLDMRMDRSQRFSAADIVNTYSERDLADLIYRYGDERQSRRIARSIVGARPIDDTKKLASVIAGSYRGRSRIHPATRTFQALRIAVNDELKQLETALPRIEDILTPGGRVAVISFHSLEDRLVKRFFAESPLLTPINKKVIQGKLVDVSNPRARSAKLRAAIKNKNRPVSGEY